MKRYDKILSVLILISGAFAVFCYGSYLVKLIIHPEGALPLASAIIVITGVCVPIALRKQIKRLTGRAYTVLKTLFCAVLCFYMVTFIAMCAAIFLPSADEADPSQLPEDTVIVTFGAKITGNKSPGKPLARRLQKTAELMEACPGALCIVTGGQGDNEPCSEAEVMRDYLVALGVDGERIILENRAKNTLENIEFTAELMKETGLDGRPVACVSTDFHIPRIRFISEKYGFADYYYRSKGNDPFNDFGSYVREYMSYVKLVVLGHL